MSLSHVMSGDKAELVINDKFTFADSNAYRKILMSVLDGGAKALTIKLEGLNFMDSSGLGMLMVALKECQQRNVTLTLYKPKGDVKALLEMTKSYERFSITD